ncbi:hypothetical protein BGZ99_004516 [Dissophora globulifera]|uniref:F-box domain-containing protein n=1 Tax=Dissophora globulifera TaxID=979702 RepID=A0A9P6UUP7_9FUNG|nr:hypothetical protein BGZ99_004516 [Dissophora globulifera]
MSSSDTARSILEVPEICFHIARYLAPADLALACRVSRSCFIPFASTLWRSIKPDQWTDGALGQALPRYSHFIRQLRFPLYIRLDDLELEYTRLVLFRAPMIKSSTVSLINGILRRNPDIEDLCIQCDSPQAIFEALAETMRIVAGMDKLKKLVMSGFNDTMPNTLDFLLNRLPKLEILGLSEWHHGEHPGLALDLETGHLVPKKEGKSEDEKPGEEEEEEAGGEVDGQWMMDEPLPPQYQYQRQKQQRSVPRALRILEVSGPYCSFQTALRVASYSPLLNRLQLAEDLMRQVWPMDIEVFAQQLSVFCPQLDELDLFDTELDGDGVSDLLTAFPRLRCLYATHPGPAPFRFLRCINEFQPVFGATLEVIELVRSRDRPQSMSTCTEILIMLSSFSNLRKVHLKDFFVFAEDLVALDMVQGSGDGVPNRYFSFACKDLEVLELIIMGPNNRWVPKDLLDSDDDSDNDSDEFDDSNVFEDSDTSDDNLSTTRPQTPPSPPSPPIYELYENVIEMLRVLPKLDQSGLRFSYR